MKELRYHEVKKKISEEIFTELNQIIKKCIHSKPVIFSESQFKKEYEKLKRRYLQWIKQTSQTGN